MNIRLVLNSLCLSLFVLFSSGFAFSQVNNYPFENEVQEKRFQSLLGELRCPKCQNQSLADSDAEIAQDLRQRVYELLLDNRADEEIRQYLIDRYGDFVTYRPPFKLSTSVLWLGPGILMFFALGFAFFKVAKSAKGDSAALKGSGEARSDDEV